MNIAVLGSGYIGLVTGTSFAEVGHNVVCVDVDQRRIAQLQQGRLPVFEPGLTDLLRANLGSGRLTFTTDLEQALSLCSVVFIVVGTPQRDDGSANLDFVWTVVDQIREMARDEKLVVIKSTVPVGTNREAQERLNTGCDMQHRVASNPEFLREGLAVDDALGPDRIVIGVGDPKSQQTLEELYAPFTQRGAPLLSMEWESAEVTKYVADCLLATKISYVNEMANFCEAVGADINSVRRGIGHDPRIGFHCFAPGAGYGGPCFPKDIRAMRAMGRSVGASMRILQAVDEVNEAQKSRVLEKLADQLGSLAGVRIAVWGLAFKPDTDDIRESPGLDLLQQLLEAGAIVQVHDPQAMDNVRHFFGDDICYGADPYEAAEATEAVAIMTEWPAFQAVDLGRLRDTMAGNVIVDGRNLFDPAQMAASGFRYCSIGRRSVARSLVDVDAIEAMPTTVPTVPTTPTAPTA
ncbi:MAG: UDP-glucose/GDP-mannose dehydrogenase family protein [Planctomycetales bacterium]|nr:UDP-glucose/GDP-mannose dehydrogenase family protein [Planctomycetales bacterium]